LGTHLLMVRGVGKPRDENVRSITVLFKPHAYQGHPRRRWAFPCRSLCGLDLHRPHIPCFSYCRMRRVHMGKMSNPAEVENVYRLIILKERRFKALKNVLLQFFLDGAEICAN
jgi:hypothetical protein